MPSKKGKRSRSASGLKSPAKKIKSNNETYVLKYSKAADTVPIALFPNGTPASSSLNLKASERNGRRILTAETPRVHYTGSEDKGLNMLNPEITAPKYLVGIVSDGNIRLVDANMFRMHPTIKAAESIATVELSLNDRDKIINARKDLVDTFGGKKKKTLAAAEKRYSVDAEALRASSGLVKQASKLDAKNRVKEEDPDLARPVPRYSKTATKPTYIYALEHIISSDDMLALGIFDFTKKLTKSPSSIVAKLNSFKRDKFTTVVSAIETIQALPSGPKIITKYKIVSYLYLLFQLYALFPSKNKQVPFGLVVKRLNGAPEELVQSLLEIFTESETRTKHVRKDESESSDLIEQDSEEVKMDEDKDDADEEVHRMTVFKKDLLIATMCVLYMHINDFKPVLADSMAVDLKIPYVKIGEHFRAVGCKLSKKSTGREAVLQIPLKFPSKLGRAPK